MVLSLRASIYHLTVVFLAPRLTNAADEKITDYDFGSLIRTDVMKGYSNDIWSVFDIAPTLLCSLCALYAVTQIQLRYH